jgi:plasmid maintenance system antidote protein VapI
MEILDYLKLNNLSQMDFAKKLSISKSTVSLLINGQRRPSPKLALRLEEETGGALKKEELLYPNLRHVA